MRLDQWLWAVRVYKTRTLAAQAIKGGHVRLNGEPVKPAREVHPGEVVTALAGDITRTLRVVGNPPARVGAPLVAEFATDLTPPEAYERRRTLDPLAPPLRPKGAGRPTKRERRALDRLQE